MSSQAFKNAILSRQLNIASSTLLEVLEELKLNGLWNDGPLRMGNHYIWVDANSEPRIKLGIPASDLDGTSLVGEGGAASGLVRRNGSGDFFTVSNTVAETTVLSEPVSHTYFQNLNDEGIFTASGKVSNTTGAARVFTFKPFIDDFTLQTWTFQLETAVDGASIYCWEWEMIINRIAVDMIRYKTTMRVTPNIVSGAGNSGKICIVNGASEYFGMDYNNPFNVGFKVTMSFASSLFAFQRQLWKWLHIPA